MPHGYLGVLLLGCAVFGALACGCSSSSTDATPSGSGCDVSRLTCGDVLPVATLASLEPDATPYAADGTLPCHFSLPNQSGGIFQVFCGGATLLTQQLTTAEGAYPGDNTETDSIGQKSFETIVGPPTTLGSFAEVSAVTTSGKYVFNVSMTNAASDITPVRALAQAIDTSLSAR